MKNLRLFVSTSNAFLAAVVISMSAVTDLAAQSPSSSESKATILQEKYTALSQELTKNQYRRPLFLESTETNNKISSTAYAVLDSSFSTVSATLKQPGQWCEILILHLNTKYCFANADTSPAALKVNIGKKTPQELPDTFLLDFSFS